MEGSARCKQEVDNSINGLDQPQSPLCSVFHFGRLTVTICNSSQRLLRQLHGMPAHAGKRLNSAESNALIGIVQGSSHNCDYLGVLNAWITERVERSDSSFSP